MAFSIVLSVSCSRSALQRPISLLKVRWAFHRQFILKRLQKTQSLSLHYWYRESLIVPAPAHPSSMPSFSQIWVIMRTSKRVLRRIAIMSVFDAGPLHFSKPSIISSNSNSPLRSASKTSNKSDLQDRSISASFKVSSNSLSVESQWLNSDRVTTILRSAISSRIWSVNSSYSAVVWGL